MAFSGIAVLHGRIARVGGNTDIFCDAVWSEDLPAPATTVNVATLPDFNDRLRSQSAFLIQAAVDAKVYVGPNPAAAGTPTYRCYAGAERIIPANKGDKVRWAAA
ncbi:UNVERIFIED_ORG: hypothetical protein ABID33_003316 [Xanthobacter viscosus]|uniref:Uncharacterized protein n=1 Tax=Xanthobacter autotrophicus TaxID=280 RepID=A0A6C1KV63_XANAU|nr:hypothetical protein [Xanthobacter autotrophicus]TLX44806.1 hypothetical protein FBQ73_01790 [Xanthobacter autotrophicus]